MTLEPNKNVLLRLNFLLRVVSKECKHLTDTNQRLFNRQFTIEQAKLLETDVDLSERVEAFVGRFSRLQDTLADKLLPTLLVALGEVPASAIDNLDRAERLGFVDSADEWMVMRQIRNQMVHEYVEDPMLLANALETAHTYVPVLTTVAKKLIAEVEQRGWAQ